jgi:hypothetical protein
MINMLTMVPQGPVAPLLGGLDLLDQICSGIRRRGGWGSGDGTHLTSKGAGLNPSQPMPDAPDHHQSIGGQSQSSIQSGRWTLHLSYSSTKNGRSVFLGSVPSS